MKRLSSRRPLESPALTVATAAGHQGRRSGNALSRQRSEDMQCEGIDIGGATSELPSAVRKAQMRVQLVQHIGGIVERSAPPLIPFLQG